MTRSRIAGIGMYVPSNVVTNNDLTKYMDTSDAWIQERTGIKERRFAHRTQETTTTMGVEAAKIAMERAGVRQQCCRCPEAFKSRSLTAGFIKS